MDGLLTGHLGVIGPIEDLQAGLDEVVALAR
jgi:hypothetical protein